MCHLFLTILFFSYGGHAHFFLSAEGNLLYCDSVLKLGDEVSDKSLPPPVSPARCSPPCITHNMERPKDAPQPPSYLHPTAPPHPVPSFHTKPTKLYLRRAAKLDKLGCGAAPLINKRCSAPWGWPLWGPSRIYPQTMEFACTQWTGNGGNEPIMEI